LLLSFRVSFFVVHASAHLLDLHSFPTRRSSDLETIDKVILAIEEEGASKIAEMLQDDDVRDAMARGVNDAIVDFLRKPVTDVLRSEEHTSELQSRENLVCRLLLEKKKTPGEQYT